MLQHSAYQGARVARKVSAMFAAVAALSAIWTGVYRNAAPVIGCARECQLRELQRHEGDMEELMQRYHRHEFEAPRRRDI